MFIKKYEALDMQEALKLVKEDLGPQAVILSSQKVRKGKGTFGLFGRSVVEVTAAVDREEPGLWETRAPGPSDARGGRPGLDAWPAAYPGNPPEFHSLGESVGLPHLEEEGDRRPAARGNGRPPGETAAFWNAFQRELGRKEVGDFPSLATQTLVVKQELAELRETVQFLLEEFMRLGGRSLPAELLTLYQRLISQGVDPKLAWSLMEKVQAGVERVEGAMALRGPVALRRAVAEMVSTSGPLQLKEGRQKVVAFVGPTGVGKTTTIAKLAAHYALMEKRRVALVTLDTYRIAAVEQLKIYARLIGIPLEVTLSGQELRAALASQQDKELILIDTAGRNQNAEVQMAELKAFFPGSLPLEIHLVISATTKERDLWEIYRKFAQVKVCGLIFTKLDESQTFGGILNQVVCSGLPLSYLTMGQRVPEDIEVATGERIADLILRGANSLQREGRESGSPV